MNPYPDQIGLFDDPNAGAYLAYFVNNNGDNTFSEYQLTNPTPDNSMDWCDWTITTSNNSQDYTGPTDMWLWNQTTGALYLWQLTGLTEVATTGLTNPTATLTYTQTEVSTGWNQGATLNTVQATEINGEPGLITVDGSGQIQSWYLDNGTTLTQAGSTQQLLTADHNYQLDQGNGGPVGTAPDSPGAGDTEEDLAAPASNTGTTWNTSDDVYSPDVAFNGSSTSYLASSGPTFNPDSSFTISAWVNPTALGGTVFSQNGTDDSSIEVSSTPTGQWSMSVNTGGTTSDSYVTTPGGTAQPGLWTDLTLTYDSAGGVDLSNLYANGVQVASLYATPPAATGGFVLGASQTDGGYGSFFTGQLADVQVWDSLTTVPTATGITGAPAIFDPLTGDQQLYASYTNSTEFQDSWSPASGWSGFENIGGYIASDTSAIYDPASGNIEVFAEAEGGPLEEDSRDPSGSWSGWQDLGGVIVTAPAALYDPATRSVQVLALGTNDTMYNDSWTAAGGWTGWVSMGAPSGETFSGTPSVVYDSLNSNLEVYARASNGVTYEAFRTPTGNWQDWVNLGGVITSGPVAVYNPLAHSEQVFGVGTNSAVYVDSWTPAGGWTGYQSLGGVVITAPGVAYNPLAGSMQVFEDGSNGAVWVDSWTSAGGWSWAELGGDSSDPPVPAYDPASGNMEVYVLGSDGTFIDSWAPATDAWSGFTNISTAAFNNL
jgi:hypothetical protein